jgi:hypothetical protein
MTRTTLIAISKQRKQRLQASTNSLATRMTIVGLQARASMNRNSARRMLPRRIVVWEWIVSKLLRVDWRRTKLQTSTFATRDDFRHVLFQLVARQDLPTFCRNRHAAKNLSAFVGDCFDMIRQIKQLEEVGVVIDASLEVGGLGLFVKRGSSVWRGGTKRGVRKMATLLTGVVEYVQLRPVVADSLFAKGYTSTIVKADTTVAQGDADDDELSRGVLIGPCYFLNHDRKSALSFVEHDDGSIGVALSSGDGSGGRYMSRSNEILINYGGHQEAHWKSSL